MFQLHVVLGQSKSWFENIPSWITAIAALITVLVAVLIARNQQRLQEALAEKQIEIQKMQLRQQDRQLKKDLFDRRFTVFTDTAEFISFVLGANGNISLPSTEYRQFSQTMEKANMLFGPDVRDYLAEVDKTVRDLYVSAQGHQKAVETGDIEAIHKNGELFSHLAVALLQKRVAVFRPYLSFERGAT